MHHLTSTPPSVDPVDLAALRTADAVAHELGLGDTGGSGSIPVRPDDLETLGIGETDLDAVRCHVEAARSGILDFFRTLS